MTAMPVAATSRPRQTVVALRAAYPRIANSGLVPTTKTAMIAAPRHGDPVARASASTDRVTPQGSRDCGHAEQGGRERGLRSRAVADQPHPRCGWFDHDASESGDSELSEAESDDEQPSPDLQPGARRRGQVHHPAKRSQQAAEHGVGGQLPGQEPSHRREIVAQPRPPRSSFGTGAIR